jgi:hypothetical protein
LGAEFLQAVLGLGSSISECIGDHDTIDTMAGVVGVTGVPSVVSEAIQNNH